MKRMKFFAERQQFGRRIAVFLTQETGGKGVGAAQPVVFHGHLEGEVMEPTMLLTPDDAQGLMDELWNCGLRPTEGTGSAGAMAATERHLLDMKSIALGLLKKDGVPL